MEVELILGDCLEHLRKIPSGSIDLIVTDPPYLIERTEAGGYSTLNKRLDKSQGELKDNSLTKGFDVKILDELLRVMKVPNLYIWCCRIQIPMYLDYFVKKHKCNFDILIWAKTNTPPTYSKKYLTDKEYCLYFRKGGYCKPSNYEKARTVWMQPINQKDKKEWGHPTIKPLNIIETIVANSSHEGDTVLDCFMGSGTTGVACVKLNRNFIGMENNEEYFKIAQQRIGQERQQLKLL